MRVLFCSENALERAENLRAAFEAYNGAKEFDRGWDGYLSARERGFDAAVVDTMPPYHPGKGGLKVLFIGHGITGGKLYAFDQPRKYLDERSRGQIDFAACASSSERSRSIMAGQLGIPIENVIPLGMPRTDQLVGCKKGDGGTFLADFPRAYLYAPTFRGGYEDAPLPRIDWALLDSLMEDGECIAVKRHYYKRDRMAGDYEHIWEVDNLIGSGPYIADCDVLATDFSSISWDAFIAGKPVIMATDGKEGYLKHRGMYWQYPEEYAARWHELEGNEAEVLGMLRDAAEGGLCARERELRDYVADMCDGSSARRVADFIAEMLDC